MTGMKRYECYRDGVLIASGNIRRIAQTVGRSPSTVGNWRWRPPNGVRMVRIDEPKRETVYERLFGTPERTVRTIIDGCCCDCYACSMPKDCPCFGKYGLHDDDAEKLLVWLRSEVDA